MCASYSITAKHSVHWRKCFEIDIAISQLAVVVAAANQWNTYSVEKIFNTPLLYMLFFLCLSLSSFGYNAVTVLLLCIVDHHHSGCLHCCCQCSSDEYSNILLHCVSHQFCDFSKQIERFQIAHLQSRILKHRYNPRVRLTRCVCANRPK